jgi:hypothetical protein
MQRAAAPDSKKVCASLGQAAAPRQARADETTAQSRKGAAIADEPRLTAARVRALVARIASLRLPEDN